MSFVEGMTRGFLSSYQQAYQNQAEKSREASRIALSRWTDAKEKYDRDMAEDQERIRVAQSIASEVPNAPPDAWKIAYNWLAQGRRVENIREDMLTGSFRPASGAARTTAVSAPATADDQMQDSGLDASDPNVQVFDMRRPGSGGPAAPEGFTPATEGQGAMPGAPAPSAPSEAPAEPDVLGGIDPQYARRARATMLAAAGSEEVLNTVMRGYQPVNTDPTSVFMPAPKSGSGSGSDKLTKADVAGMYWSKKSAAVNGEPGAVEEFQRFQSVELPILMEALSITDTDVDTGNLTKAYDNLNAALKSGDPQQIAQAQGRVDQLLFVEGQQAQARTSGQQRQLVTVGPDGVPKFAQGFIQPTAGGTRVVDVRNQPLQGDWREVTEDEKKDGDEAIKAITNRLTAHQESMVNTTGALRLTGELVGIARENPQVLTRVAGFTRDIQSLLREAGTFTNVFNQIMQEKRQTEGENATVTRDEFERALQASGALPDGMTLEQAAAIDINELSLGQSAADLARLRSLFESKIYLMAFRAGGLEGQTGNAMSNRDFDRLLQVIQSSSNAQTFETNLSDYIRGRVNALVDNEQLLLSDDTGLVGRFKQQYGYTPVANVVKPLETFIAERNDPALRTAYEMVMGRGQNPMPGSNQAANTRPAGGNQPQTQQQAQPTPNEPAQFPGYTFVGYSEDNRPVYQKDGTDERYVLE